MNDSEKKVNHCIGQAITETLEGMAFIVVSPDSQPASVSDKDKKDWFWAQVEVIAPLQGKFTMAFSRAIAEEILCSLFPELETSRPRADDKLADVMKEIVNIMAGRFLNQLVSEELSFSLGLPEFGNGWPQLGQNRLYRFVTDDGKPLIASVAIA